MIYDINKLKKTTFASDCCKAEVVEDSYRGTSSCRKCGKDCLTKSYTNKK